MKQTLLLSLILVFWGSIVSAQTTNRPLILPFQDPPGIDTWLLGQAYGNTTGAYRFGEFWYSAGQGLHFGLDFSAPCGSPLVAVADGTVAFVDNLNFGSAPHNLILRHEGLGLTSLYGHLLNRSMLQIGETVTQGQLVGYSGDPDGTCESRPHLHLEIRSLDYRTAYNPIDYMDANWNTLALIGSFSNRNFQMNLDNARQWVTLDDQPAVSFGGRILNNYVAPYPAENNPPANPPLAVETAPIADERPITFRVFDPTGCCWEQWWHPTDPELLYTIDGFPNERAGVYEYDAQSGSLIGFVGTAPPAFHSPDYTYAVIPTDAGATIQEVSSGETFSVMTGGAIPAINTDNSRLLWVNENGDDIPGGTEPLVTVTISALDGNNAQVILSEQGLDARWLDANRLMLTISERPYTQVDIYDVRDNSRYTLGRWYRPRGLSIAPAGNRIMFYLAYQPDPAQNGVYWMDITENAITQRVDWFGSYRWRDENSLFMIPYDPTTDIHQLMLYDISTDTLRAITDPIQQPFSVMDGRWSVNADGTHILYRSGADRNLWLMDITTQ